MSAISNSDAGHYELMSLPVGGRLRGAEVRRILDDERTFLAQQVLTQTCCCLSYRAVNRFTPLLHKQIPWHTRVYVEVLIPIATITTCYTILACVILLTGEKAPIVTGIYVGIIGTLMLIPTIWYCKGVIQRTTHHDLLPGIYYPIKVAAIIDRRCEIIANYLAKVNDDRCVPPAALARLIASVKLRKTTESSLVSNASPAEFKMMLDEFSALSMGTIQMPDHYQLLREMLENPPQNKAHYHEKVIRLHPVLHTAYDYQALADALEDNDPRRVYLDSNVIHDADSAETSTSSESVYIDIPELDSLTIREQIFMVDMKLLREKSSWFATYTCFSIPTNALFQDELILIITNLTKLPALWNSLDPEKKNKYLQLHQCLCYYKFCNDADLLTRALFNCDFLSIEEKFVTVKRVITTLFTQNISLSYWEERLYDVLRDDSVTEEMFIAALDFCIEFFPENTIPRFSEYFCSKKDATISGIIIKNIALRRDLFPTCIGSLRSHLRAYLREPLSDLEVFIVSKEFMSWLGEEMNLPLSDMVTLENFQRLWPLCAHDQGVGIALHNFASSNRSQVMRLWDAGLVPENLVLSLPI